MNNDGSPDVIAAEHRGAKRLEIWENVGHGASWIEHVVSTGRENHLGALVADLDGDGDLDIVGIAWDGYKFLHLWRNDAILRLGGALKVVTPVISPEGGIGPEMRLVHIATETTLMDRRRPRAGATSWRTKSDSRSRPSLSLPRWFRRSSNERLSKSGARLHKMLAPATCSC